MPSFARTSPALALSLVSPARPSAPTVVPTTSVTEIRAALAPAASSVPVVRVPLANDMIAPGPVPTRTTLAPVVRLPLTSETTPAVAPPPQERQSPPIPRGNDMLAPSPRPSAPPALELSPTSNAIFAPVPTPQTPPPDRLSVPRAARELAPAHSARSDLALVALVLAAGGALWWWSRSSAPAR